MIPIKSANTASRMVDDQAVVLILDKQESMVLNDTGAFIWESCDGKRNVEEIASSLAIIFEVSAQVALSDCLEFIDKMAVKEALILNKP